MHGKLTPWALGKLPVNIPDPASRGISLQQVQELSEFIQRLCKTGLLQGHRDNASDWLHWEDILMEDIASFILKPAIRYLAADISKDDVHHDLAPEYAWSWVEIVANGPQDPKVFVSFSLHSGFRDFMGSVHHLADDQGMTIRDNMWIGMFAREDSAPVHVFDLLNSPVFSAFGKSEATALFLDEHASILERSWSIFEMAIITDTATSRRRWKLKEELAREEGCSIFSVNEEKVLQIEKERFVEYRAPSSDDIFQSENCRLDWQVRSELAGGGDPFSVPWEEVRERIRLMRQGGGIDTKPLLLCRGLSHVASTPDGLVGTRRATSVPVLHALLHSFCCSKTDAASKAERRLVMNYIANCYCEENRSSAHLLDGIRTDGDVYELENVETVSEVRRLDGSPEYRHEHSLVTSNEHTAVKFKILDHSIRQECRKALEARGVKDNFDNWNNFFDLKRVCNVMPPEHRALTLSQLRILANMLRRRLVEFGGLPAWNKASSRDLWNRDKELHVLRDILPVNSSFSECFQTQRQLPDTYVICPEDVKLVALFSAIERHAEAHLLPEKTTYYVDALCRRRGELEKSANESAEKTQRLLSNTGRGVLLILDQPTSLTWRHNVASLWCLYELFFADRQGLLWDVACGEGIVAMRAPLSTKRWVFGQFDSAIAWNLSSIRVKAEAARCTVTEEKDILLSKLMEFGKNCITEFEQKMTAKVPARMLGPVLRQAACMRDNQDFERLRDACDIMAKLRCSGAHINLASLEGGFGESALHIAAAAAVDGSARCARAVEMLVRMGMDVNAQDDAGETPLHWAAMTGRAWATGFLLRNGSDPLLASWSGPAATFAREPMTIA
ncbi:Tnni3k [Symbiodinium natans]|uniref:Tnni3k protein n=1 Tax=Symbiodinium natans TaxID=878477 RepID=A0A812KW77_9DINO|nr:Tnni3k [Symbiodinium natans]